MKQLSDLVKRSKWYKDLIIIKVYQDTYIWRVQKIGEFKILVTVEYSVRQDKYELKHWYFQTWNNSIIYSHGDKKQFFISTYNHCFTNKHLNNSPVNEKLNVRA